MYKRTNQKKRIPLTGKALTLLLSLMMATAMLLGGFSTTFADSTNNAQDPYSDTVTTRVGSYTVDGVHQSTSSTSITTFGSAMPLSTIYIDMAYLKPEQGIFTRLADPSNPSQAAFADGIGIQSFTDNNGVTKLVASYNPVDPDPDDDFVPMQLYANNDNYLPGNLFSYTFPNAALLADGTRANVLITYSNAHILVDQRLGDGEYGMNEPLDNYVTLAYGNDVMYSNNSTTMYANAEAVTGSSKYPATGFPTSDAYKYPMTGLSMDARIQVVDDQGKPIEGTFIFPTVGLNIDRDPLTGSGNNTDKPLWYLDDQYPEYDFFSESMRINSGTASDIYVRPNTSQQEISGQTNSAWYNPRIYEVQSGAYQGAVKITADTIATPATMPQANNNAYSSGFITTANASAGISVTLGGHGSKRYGMDTFIINGATIWHRIRSITSSGGKIQTTTEANDGGTLSDGGDILGPGTYVVPDGKTTIYTMTPMPGYSLDKLYVNNDLSVFPTEIPGVADMSAGDTKEVDWILGGQNNNLKGKVKKNDDGSYTFTFPYNNDHHTILVTWKPNEAKVKATKVWYDKNNEFNMRKDVTMHLIASIENSNGSSYVYPADYMPARKINKQGVADGYDAGNVVWGDGTRYTGINGETVYDSVDSLPQKNTSLKALYYFYNYDTHKFDAYTYNTVSGEYDLDDENMDGDGDSGTSFYVNFLPKYNENGDQITYTVKEDDIVGYSQNTTTQKDGNLDDYPDPNPAEFEYKISNTLDPTGVVRVKVGKALEGRALNSSDDYVFVLAGEDRAPMPVKSPAKLPTEGEDIPETVVAHAEGTVNAGSATADADFGIIAYRKTDLDATKVTYGTPSSKQTADGYVQANAEQKEAIRYWTLSYTDTKQVHKRDKNGRPLYIDPTTGEETTDADDGAGTDYAPAMVTKTKNITRTFDLNDTTDRDDFETNLPAKGISTDEAEGTFYDRVFHYTITENPKHPNNVENDDSIQNMTVRVIYNERKNKLYIDDEDELTDEHGVQDITAEKTAKLSSPDVTLHKDFFTNKYDNEVSWDPELVKTLNGRPISKDQFKDYFTIKAEDTTENIAGQVSNIVAKGDTPMPGDADASGEYPKGGSAFSNSQKIKSATSAPKGTNDVKALIGFDTITYTNDDLKKEIKYSDATSDQKRQVIYWQKNGVYYGPIPADAKATVVNKADGSKEEVIFNDATQAQREEVFQSGDGWVLNGKIYIDISLMKPADQEAALIGSTGTYYLNTRNFTYKIWEHKVPGTGYTPDEAHNTEDKAYTVIVTVERVTDESGVTSLKVTPKVNGETITDENNPLKFENKYEAKGEISLKGVKVLSGRNLKADEFSFEISPVTADAPLPANTTVKNKADGTIDFDKITFTHNNLKEDKDENPGAYDAVRTVDGFYEKTFVYEIKETAPASDGNGITTDKSTKTIAITVREDNEGKIEVVAVNGTTVGDADRMISFTAASVNFGQFNNDYEASGNDTVDATKTLKGGKLKAGDFHFQLLDSQGNVLGTTANADNGAISFPVAYNLSQVKADATSGLCTYDDEAKTWTYTYKVKELQTDNRGDEKITYDATGIGAGYEVTVVIKDNEDGTLDIKPSTDTPAVAFINTVSTRDLTLQKIWIDKDADQISKVTRPATVKLTVTADVEDANVLSSAEGTEVTQGWTLADGKSTKDFTLTKADDEKADALWSKTLEGLPRYKSDGTAIVYTVDELDENVPVNYKKTSVVTVGSTATVINTYTITEITGTKEWVDGGRSHAISADLDGKLTVKWTDAGGASGTVENPHIDYDNALSTYTVIGLPKYSDNGKLRTYYVEETQLEGYKEPEYKNAHEVTADEAVTTDENSPYYGKHEGDIVYITGENKAYDDGKIINKIDGTIDVIGTKVWKDGTDDPQAPAAPTLTLYRKSSKTGATEEVVTKDAEGETLSVKWNSDKTEYEYKGVAKYDDEGYEYTYWVTEETVEGYLPPQYSDGDKANNEGSITNVKEPEDEKDIPVTKVLTGSTLLKEWSNKFKISLYTEANGSGSQIGTTQAVGDGTLSEDGLSDSADVTFSKIKFRVHNDNGTVKGQVMAADNTWVDMTENPADSGKYEITLYAYETPIAEGNTGLTQPSDGGTPIKIVVVNNNDGTMFINLPEGVTAGDVIEDYNDGTVLAEAVAGKYLVKNKHEQNINNVDIDIEKTLRGRDLTAADGFTFTATYVPDTSLEDNEQARLVAGLDATEKSIGMSDMSIGQSTADTDHPKGIGNSATGKISFNFTKTGTYKFKVTESGNVDGVTNDTKDGEEVTVKIEKNADGTLKKTVTYADGSEADFENEYDATGDVEISVKKLLNGISWNGNMDFWFTLEPVNAPPGYTTSTMPQPDKPIRIATNQDKTVSWIFGDGVFKLEDQGKEFIYSVTEAEPHFDGYVASEWDLDISKPADGHTIKVVPFDKGDGTLDFKIYYDGSTTATTAPMSITNRKKGENINIFASKQVVDRDGNDYWPEDLDAFELNLDADPNNPGPMPAGATGDTKTVEASDTTVQDFGVIDLSAEYVDLADGASKTFTYTITETEDASKTYLDYGIEETASYTVTVKIEKDTDGNVIPPVVKYYKGSASGTELDVSTDGYPVIKNEYKAEGDTEIDLTKVLNGRELEAGEFTFTLYDNAGNPLYLDSDGYVTIDASGSTAITDSNAANGKVNLGKLGFNETYVPSSPLTYVLREDIPVGAKAQDDPAITFVADTTLAVRDAHVWVKDGVTYDPAKTHPVTIILTDDGKGKITATVNPASTTVTNTYEAEGDQEFQVYKKLEERPIARGGFDFYLEAVGIGNSDTKPDVDSGTEDKVPMPAGTSEGKKNTTVLPTAAYEDDGTASFGNIKYTMEDLAKYNDQEELIGYDASRRFVYKIYEDTSDSDAHPGVTYDETEYYAVVTVSNANTGELSVSVKYYKDVSGTPNNINLDEDTDTVDFKNIYDADGTATLNSIKEVLGRNWHDDDEFTFLIEPFEEGNIYSYTGGVKDVDHKIAKADVPLPGNTIDQDNRAASGNSSTGPNANINAEGQYEAIVNNEGDPVGALGRQAVIEDISITDDMLKADLTDGRLKGRFFYKITEKTTSLPEGFEQTDGSTTTYYARVDVIDDRAGTLQFTTALYYDATSCLDEDPPAHQGATPVFQNTYDAEGEGSIPVVKFVDLTPGEDDGWDSLSDADEFTFTISPIGTAPDVEEDTISIKKTDAGHTQSFVIPDGSIKLADLTKQTTSEGQLTYSDGVEVDKDVDYAEFIYQIVENDIDIKGVDKDETVIYAKLIAIDCLDGTIDTQLKYYTDASCATEIDTDRNDNNKKDAEFTNVYRNTMDVIVQKVWHDDGEDATVAARPEIKIQLNRQIEGGNLETLISLDGNAKLYAAPATPGADPVEITYAGGEATVAADQLPVTFKNLPATDKNGNPYTYNIVETYVGGDYYESKKPEIIQEGTMDNPETDGDETEPRILKLTNTMKTKVTVEKVWRDDDDDTHRGDVIIAALYKDGVLLPGNIALVKSDSNPAWTYTFEELPMYNDSDELINYTVKEMAVPEEYFTSLVEYTLDNSDEDSWSKTQPDNWDASYEKYVRITNILLRDVEVEKVWDGIPVTNVTFKLYRSTDPSPASAIKVDEETGLHNWTSDSTWELVKDDDDEEVTHVFPTDDFNPETGGSKKFTFEDLARYDKNGNEYTYRVKETTTPKFFTIDQNSDVKITDKNDYTGSGTVKPNVVKELAGRDWQNTETLKDEFYFKIEAVKKLTGGDGDWERVNVTEFEGTPEDQAAKAKVPLPDDGDDQTDNDDIAKVTATDTPVGAIGRSVDFLDITYLAGNDDTAHVGEGETTNYYYKIYEVDENGDQITGDVIDGITYDEAIHYLRVEVIDNGDGTVTTNRYWDGAATSTAVPVFTNEYKATGIVSAHIIKNIDGRDYADGNQFAFTITNVAGAPIRLDPDDEASYDTKTVHVAPIGTEVGEGVYVHSDVTGLYNVDMFGPRDTKARLAVYNYITSEDLTDGKGTFIYEIKELDKCDTHGIEHIDDLNYDQRTIYVRFKVTDNFDGTLTVVDEYFTDSACTKPAKDMDGNIPKLKIDKDTREVSPGIEGDIIVQAAYFRNTVKQDIDVIKSWVDEDGNPTPATDNVTVELWRYPVDDIDDPGTLPTTYDESDGDWELVPGGTYTFQIGEFTEDNGYKSTHPFTVDRVEYDTGYKYIYRVREITGSKAYETKYTTFTLDDDDKPVFGTYANLDTDSKVNNTMTTEEGLAVQNKIKATNVANIAAVKQLIGRDWLSRDASGADTDRYHFTLTPLGMGTYDANGELVIQGGKVVYDQTVGTDIPMPTDKYSSEATGTNDAVAAKTTQYADTTKVPAEEIVGEGERLARYAEITYTLQDLTYDAYNRHMHGDFFYKMTEVIPAAAVAVDKTTGKEVSPAVTYGAASDEQKAQYNWKHKGVTYDATESIVHVQIHENRIDELIVQVAYDEKEPGKVESGTKFTPVYTNHYDAEGTPEASVEKRIMGRKWAEGDEFEFSLKPIGGAPFEEQKDKLTAKITVGADEADSYDPLTANFDFGEFKFKLSDLNKTTTTAGEIKYSTGADVLAGTPYGVFLYAVEETSAKSATGQAKLAKDEDTEYIQFTVIDKGDGTFDIQSKIFEDRYASKQRMKPGTTNVPATSTTFVNQALRDITVIKTWRGDPLADANVTLQYGTKEDGDEDYTWTDYKTYAYDKDATPKDTEADDIINGLEVPVTWYEYTFTDVPVYANDGDDNDLSDAQLRWRIVETSMTGITTYYVVEPNVKYDDRQGVDRYNETADEAQDPELGGNKTVADLDDKLYVTNVNAPSINPVAAKVSGVKDIKGREWNNTEQYEFTLTPVGIGTYDDDGKLYVLDNGKVNRDKLKKSGGTVITDIPMPGVTDVQPNPTNAIAKVDTAHPEYQLSDSQWQTYFDDIIYKVEELALIKVGDKEVLMGDFFYDMTEVIPVTAVAVNKTSGEEVSPAITYGAATEDQKAQYNWKYGDMIYDTKSYEVHVHVERVGDHLTATVSYDGKDVGGAVPVFTNRYVAPSIDIPVMKSWVKDDGTGNLVPAEPTDNVTIELYRYAVVDPENPGSSLPTTYGETGSDWEYVATHTYDRGVFEESSDYKFVYTFEDVATDEIKNGTVTGKKYIYRVREITGSKSFETKYATMTVSGTAPNIIYTPGEYAVLDTNSKVNNTMTTEEGLAVQNKIKATNVANIAAVKQLLGRDWKATDKFEFKLEAVKGKLGDGKDVAADDVPMPTGATGTPPTVKAETDNDKTVGENERLASFAGITYKLDDLAYNPTTKRMEGDFYYKMYEVLPKDKDGYMTYDTSNATVHVQVRENRTGKLEVVVAYDEVTEGVVDTGTKFTPVFKNRYEEVNIPVRVTWVNDTDYDETVGDGETPESTSNDRPDKVFITLQMKTHTYTYDGEEYPTKALALAAAEAAGDNDPEITVSDDVKWVDARDPENPSKPWTIELSKSDARDPDNWFSDEFKKLPKYDAEGTTIEYRAQQTGYQFTGEDPVNGARTDNLTAALAPASYTPVSITAPLNGMITSIINKLEVFTITGTKTWIDEESTPHNNSSDVKLIVKRKAPTESSWTTLSETNGDYHVDWSGSKDANFTIKGLTQYVEGTTTEYDYEVSEDTTVIPDGYAVTYKPTGATDAGTKPLTKTGGEIINTAGVITVTATKIWQDDDEVKADTRKDVQFQLYREIDGAKKKVGAAQTVTADTSATAGSEAGSAVWTDLRIKSGTHDVIYTVEEVSAPPEGYSIEKVEYQSKADDSWSTTKPDDWNGNIRIHNRYNDSKVNIPVMKKWEDNNDQAHIRPDSVKVRVQAKVGSGDWTSVYVKNGRLVPEGTSGATAVDDIVLDKSVNWKKLFKGLPLENAQGSPVTYRVVELDSDGTVKTDGETIFDEYTVSITGDQDSGFTITNSYQPETLTITATKEWAGDSHLTDNQKKALHTDVIVHLYGYKDKQVVYYAGSKLIEMTDAGEPVGPVTWENLPARYYNDEDLDWKVVEDPVFGYTSEVSGNATDGFKVTNTYAEPVTEISVSKKWTDSNYEGRPTKVTYILWQKILDGDTNPESEYDRKTVNVDSATGAANAKWSNLPVTTLITTGKTEDTTRIEYQDAPKMEGDNYVYREIATGDEVIVTPDEKDTYDQDPEYEQVILENVPVEITEEGVDITKEVAVLYMVEELYDDSSDSDAYNLDKKGYEAPVYNITEFGSKVEVENIRPVDTVNVKVKKTWNDQDDKDGFRPTHVDFILKNGDTVVDTATAKGGSEWTYTFTNLPKTDANGVVINYTVDEEDVPKYTKTVEPGSPAYVDDENGVRTYNWDVINTYVPGSMNLTAIKVWKGDDTHKDKRADVDIQLIRVKDGKWEKVKDEELPGDQKAIQTISKDEAVDTEEPAGSVTWVNLPTRVGGKDVAYTVQEVVAPEGYSASYSDVTRKEGSENEFEVTVTNNYGVPDPQGDVLYVDPKNKDGYMIVGSTKYDTYGRAGQAADKMENKPANPSHEGYTFVGWALNYDGNGNYVFVAKYSDPPKPEKVVSYVDPQTGKIVTGRKGEVKKPADPSASNMQFVKWVEVEDADGNTIFVAQYECDCGNGSPKSADKSKVDTGDDNDLYIWIWMLIMAAAAFVATGMMRNRNLYGGGYDDYKPKH